MRKSTNFSSDIARSASLTRSWTLGTILGDAYIDPQGRLCITHSTRQEDYFLWKFQKLQALGLLPEDSKPQKRSQKHKRSGKTYEVISLRTKHGAFLEERNFFYSSGIKEIPSTISEIFHEEALAVWFMDDGGRNSAFGAGMVLDVSGYSPESQQVLQEMMHSKFQLSTTFHRRSDTNTKLYIRASSASRFCELVWPWMFDGMKRKLTRTLASSEARSADSCRLKNRPKLDDIV